MAEFNFMSKRVIFFLFTAKISLNADVIGQIYFQWDVIGEYLGWAQRKKNTTDLGVCRLALKFDRK